MFANIVVTALNIGMVVIAMANFQLSVSSRIDRDITPVSNKQLIR